MKAIFPCLGSLIMTKKDIEQLKNYYDDRQVSATTESPIAENSFFNYFEDNTNLILNNVTPLTVSKLKSVLGINSNTEKQSKEVSNKVTDLESPIDDDSILSNPFFTTLKPVD